tara:strand:+ start:1733 stop:2788 length:1056 start_codon:yes stop_codon:yes gene_type:complete
MKNHRYYLLDIARGIAAFSIVIFHYKLFYYPDISLVYYDIKSQPFYNSLSLIYNHGWMAVQFFFIISGFIFYLLYSDKIKKNKISKFDFFKFRFSRLYPLHFLTLICCLIIFYFSKQQNFPYFINGDLKHFILNIFLIQKWGFENIESFNQPSWSISIEALLYIVFFFVFTIKKNNFTLTIISLILSILIFFINKYIGYGLYCFYIGGLTYLIYKKIIFFKTNLKFNCILTSIFMLVTVILLYYIDNPLIMKIAVFSFLFPLIIINLMLIQFFFIKAGNFLSIIGDISYSVYLLHFVLLTIIKIIIINVDIKIDFNSILFFLSYLLFIFICSCISFFYFEKPMQKIIRYHF